MSKFLLDYVFPISVIEAIPQASTAFLKQVIVVAKPAGDQSGNVGDLFQCVNMTEVEARVDDAQSLLEIQELFNAGMSKVYILLANDLDIAAYLTEHGPEAYTVLITSAFSESDVATGYLPAVPAIAAELKVQDILYVAKVPGVAANSLTIALTTGGTAESEVVTKVSNVIEIQIEDGISTAAQVAAAINNPSSQAYDFIEAIVDDGDETDPQVIFSATPLDGGVDEVPPVPGTAGLAVGPFEGVVGYSSDDAEFDKTFGTASKRVGFFGSSANRAKNMFFAFGKLLSNLASWRNQQYIEMPFDDEIDELGEALSLFDDRVSFALADDEFGKRLGLFTAGGKAIAAPYILKNLRIDLQSRALQWIAQNQPAYTLTEASLLEQVLQDEVIQSYVERRLIESGSISITLVQQNFVANGTITVPTPKALWRVVNEMTETV